MFISTRTKITYSLVFLVIGFIIGFLVAPRASNEISSESSNTIKIGFVSPLTGDVANYGESARGGAEIALEEVNNAWASKGMKMELIFEDGQCKPQPASTATSKLINLDKVVAVTGFVCSTELLSSAPMFNDAKVVGLGVATSSPDITNAGDYIFRVWPSDVFQAGKIANYIFSNKKIKTAATLHPQSDYNLALSKAFKKDFESLGGSVVAEETYEQDAKDFKTQITKIISKAPEAIYVIPYGEGGLVTKQLKELGFTGSIFASETYGTPEIIADAGDSSEGVIYATPLFDESLAPTEEVLQKFKQKYGKDPSFAVITASAYDAINILAAAIESNGPTSEDIKKYLLTVKNYPGVSGTITIDDNGDAIKDFQLMIVRNGKFEKLAE